MNLFNNDYVICVATPCNERDFADTPFGQTLAGLNIPCHVEYNNTRGLPTVYNERLSDYPDKKIIFVHDDVEIHDRFLTDKLDKAFLMYDVVGLAGGKEADFGTYTDYYKQSLMWHLMAPRDKLSGFVSHYFGDNKWNSSMFGLTPSRTVTLDGLFIAVDAKKCREKGVWFDEDFTFHYYDLAFSLSAHNKGLKVGTYPIFVVHHGLGHVDNMEEFLASQKIFNQTYAPK